MKPDLDLHLILGGARSGKSRHAEALARQAEAAGSSIVYVATAWAGDEEMQARIAEHRARRPASWIQLELPDADFALAHALRAQAAENRCVLVDCLTLWLAQHLCPPPGVRTRDAQAEVDAVLEALPALSGRVIFVSNEIGLGVMPMGAETRRTIDALGRLHQQLAQRAHRVTLMVAGLPLELKPSRGSCP
ncbi:MULTISPECIES: bifunctional adenosylcobinamide kinase/adenosylcobinamide-phosphate guanylyltransferase [Caldimonas]|uniref:bifunctional adenosylcobinamide kinase/adenosylcobinamide-phosphate guanylyltransferase n=1 Tax=Caldimonas TaxID=196013 RepID=UPI00078049F6|nr:bifunctional adenosylcobinamide kinase/adenosylcobinamide-phosphate guanylyltransferase [Caldimonas taiwanensis]MCX7659833.1 bifunctional adenosylcobinamide kinase/adenosylcobinamide-phosphate guanylyltransferase [Caldimonas manganoxidans]